MKIKRLEGGESSALGRWMWHAWGWGRSVGMEVDHKPFELGQGGQASDKVIWCKISVIWNVGKLELDEVVGG
jgi:hypothetical protein